MNEFLIAVFVPAAVTFTGLWAAFRGSLDGPLRAMGLPRIVPDPLPFVAVRGGYGRFLLLIVLTAVIVLVYVAVYVRVLRGPLRDRGLV